MKNIQLFLLVSGVFVISLLFHGCYKEGHGGKASIIVTVRHTEDSTDNLVRGATVMLKYGATSSPGTTADAYDQVKIADTIYAKAAFTNLYKGDYYIYAEGVDSVNSTAGTPVAGGKAVEITKRAEVLEVVLTTKKK